MKEKRGRTAASSPTDRTNSAAQGRLVMQEQASCREESRPPSVLEEGPDGGARGEASGVGISTFSCIASTPQKNKK